MSDRYILEHRIATGGMGQVWRALDTVLSREVALKLLKEEYAGDADFRARFEAEAKHAASLHHPNVAAVFDFGEMRVGEAGAGPSRPFLVMELVHGRPLSELLRSGERMPPDVAADLVAQAADGIAAAHALGIVHRDVKPANLLVTDEGRVKVTDFGIARAGEGTSLTLTGQILGTPSYLSPEQAEGGPASTSSDVYALGVVLYECLAGRRPFTGDTPVTTALAHLRDPLPALPDDVPPALRQVAERALAKDPGSRIPSALELAAALRAPEAWAASQEETRPLVLPPAPPTAGEAVEGEGSGRRTRWGAWLAAVVVLLLVIGGFVALSSRGNDTAADTKPKVEKVRVRKSDYVGSPLGKARTSLKDLGLVVRVERRTNPGSEKADTVADVDPTGLVAPGATITLTVWSTAPVPATPTTTPVAPSTPADPAEPADPAGSGKTDHLAKHAKKPGKPGTAPKHGPGPGHKKKPHPSKAHKHGKGKGKNKP